MGDFHNIIFVKDGRQQDDQPDNNEKGGKEGRTVFEQGGKNGAFVGFKHFQPGHITPVEFAFAAPVAQIKGQ